jgi:hypothetical protein
MRLVWPMWGGRAAPRSRPRVQSRPRVALAAQAARAARAALLSAPAPMGAAAWAPAIRAGTPALSVVGAARPQGTGLSPDLIRATARAARASGRQPAEVWSEALSDWLAGREAAEERPLLSVLNSRRAQTWQAIEATLGELRAS